MVDVLKQTEKARNGAELRVFLVALGNIQKWTASERSANDREPFIRGEIE